jgi:hypothetical protein
MEDKAMAHVDDERRTRLRAISRYRPAFEDPAAPVGKWFQPEALAGCISPAWFALNETAEQFVAECYAHGWVLAGFDWASWAQTQRAQALRDEPAALASATEHELAQLLTVVIRQSRFVEGALATAFASGLILHVLNRAEQIALAG